MHSTVAFSYRVSVNGNKLFKSIQWQTTSYFSRVEKDNASTLKRQEAMKMMGGMIKAD